MKHIVVSLFLAVGLVVGLILGVLAQGRNEPNEAVIGQIQPLLLDMQQQVPVSVTLLVPIGSSTHTVTVPLRLDLGVTLDIADTVTVSVDAASAEAAVVEVMEPTPTPDESAGPRIAIVTSRSGTVYEVTSMRVKYLDSNSKYLEFSFTLETGQVTRQVDDRVSLDDLSRLTFDQQTIGLYLSDGPMFSLSPEAYAERDASGRLVESGVVTDLALTRGDPPQALVGFEGNVETSLGMESSFEIPLEGVETIEFEGEP